MFVHVLATDFKFGYIWLRFIGQSMHLPGNAMQIIRAHSFVSVLLRCHAFIPFCGFRTRKTEEGSPFEMV